MWLFLGGYAVDDMNFGPYLRACDFPFVEVGLIKMIFILIDIVVLGFVEGVLEGSANVES